MTLRRLLLAVGLLLVAAATGARADEFPAPTGFLVDQAGVVPAPAQAKLEAELRDYSRRTTNQVGVAVVQTTGDLSIEDYSLQLFNRWGVGQKGANNGVLLVIAVRDHTDRIEVGTGLTDQLTDDDATAILAADVAPYARKGDFAGAVQHTVAAIRAALDAAGPQDQPAPADAKTSFGGGSAQDPVLVGPGGFGPSSGGGSIGGGTFFAVGVSLFVLLAGAMTVGAMRGGGTGYSGGYIRPGGVGFGAGMLFGSMLNQGRQSYGSSSASSFGGGFGGGFSGGGGFGGGMSSGGGASGGW